MKGDKRFNFTRRAKNTSWSDRTAKLGTLKGSAKDAIKKAFALAVEHGEVTVTDADDLTTIGVVVVHTYADKPDAEGYVQLRTRKVSMEEFLK